MTANELIKELENLVDIYGNLKIYYDSTFDSKHTYVDSVLNIEYVKNQDIEFFVLT